MSEKAPYTSLLNDSSKFDLGSLDLFDRVINVKLTNMDGEEFVIRSDYETYFPEAEKAIFNNDTVSYSSLNKCYIRKCQYKPSLKIQYKRVSLSTPVSIDLFVSNFYMLDKNGKMLKTFNNITNGLYKLDIQMGYFGQFKSAMQGSGKASDISVEKLFDFNPENYKGHGITTISCCNVEYVQTDSLPPDMVVHIHAYVGNYYAGSLEKESTATDYESAKSELIAVDVNKVYPDLDSNTIIGKLMFECVTKNWVKDITALPDETKSKITDKGNGVYITTGDPLTDTEALKYGIRVYFSTGAKKIADAYDEEHSYDKVKADVKRGISTASGKANAVLTALGVEELRLVAIPTTGDFLLYVEGEMKKPDELIAESKLSKVYNNEALSLYWEDKLPAVYNITTDAICTIVCPFFFFINPFQKFYFKTAYALGGLVSYYAKFTASEDEFYALWQDISFATVEDVNECTIACTGKEKS